jgi:hypothetical protein
MKWVPRLLACTSMCAAATVLTPSWTERWAGIVAAACFSLIEFTWYSVTTELDNGEVALTPFSPTVRTGHTTAHQFLANVIWTPVLLFTYCDSVPFNVWLLEIVEGYSFMTLHRGRNPAWTYSTPDACFDGNVRTGFAKLWLGLGLVLELGGRELVRRSGEVLAAAWSPKQDQTPFSSIALTLSIASVLCLLVPRLLRE